MVMKPKNRPDTGRGFGTSVGRLLSFDLCYEQGLEPGINSLPASY
jgi:hypothetical protein